MPPAWRSSTAARAQRVVLVDGRDSVQGEQRRSRQPLHGRAVSLDDALHLAQRGLDGPRERLRIGRRFAGDDLRRKHGDRFSRRPRGRSRRLGLRGRGRIELRFVTKDRALELMEERARLDPELGDEETPGLLIKRESVGLSPRSVQDEHQVGTQSLAVGMLRRQCLQLPDQLGVATERQIGFDPILERREPQLLQASRLRLREPSLGEVRERLPAPQAECLAEQVPRPGCLARRERGAPLGGQALESSCVDRVGIGTEDVAAGFRPDQLLACSAVECLSELGDRVLDDLRRCLRRLLLPELVDEGVAPDDFVDVQGEQGRDLPLASAPQPDDGAVANDLERSEDAYIDRAHAPASFPSRP